MPSTYVLKPKFQNLLGPLSDVFAHGGVRANQVMALALRFATGAAIFHYHSAHSLLWLPAVLFVRIASYSLDDMIAREHPQKTPLGAILNELGDAFSDARLYLP